MICLWGGVIMPKKSSSSSTNGLVGIIKGPIGFVLALFVVLTLAGMTALNAISTELTGAVTTVAAFFAIYMIIWVINYLK